MQPDIPGFVPPGRSLLWVRAVPGSQGGGAELGCDCGTVARLVLDGIEQLTDAGQAAVTCDGCHSVRWFTVTPRQEAGDG